jgi:hypothetical protein
MLTLKLLNVNLKRVSLDDTYEYARIARMKEVSILMKNKRTLLGMMLIGVLIYTSYHVQENSSALKKITTFESGVQTCFGRVNQTYTAKLLDDGASQYLSQNFEALTEECFAESIINVDENFKVQMALVAKKLSNLASNVHWFHEDLITPTGVKSLSNGEGRDIGNRFEKIENTKDEILEATESFKVNITNEFNNGKSVFYVTATLLIFVMLLEYLSNTKKNISNNAREIEANGELLVNGGIHSVKLGEIIRQALEQNDLNSCAKLFNNYYLNASYEKTVKTRSTMDTFIAPAVNASVLPGISGIASAENLDKIWNDDSIGLVADSKMKGTNSNGLDSLNLDNFVSKAIDVLSDKLFSKGVQLEININENIFVEAKDEILEQILYHAISYSVNSTHDKTTSSNTVAINAIKLGNLTALDITSTGKGFDAEVLKSRIGLSLENNNLELDIDLQICQSLASEINGKMQLDNRLSQMGEVVGSRIKLILKTANQTASTSKLVNLKRGSKKEVLAQLNERYF